MKDLKKYVLSALFAALCCIATMLIQCPSPTGGYIHLGDGFVILSGIILGPIYGGLAAGIGSMFADIFTGYLVFAPATFIIKALAAVASAYIFKLISKAIKGIKSYIIGGILCGIAAIVIVTVGYLLCETFLKGFSIAVTGVVGNIVQGTGGLIIATILIPILENIPDIQVLDETQIIIQTTNICPNCGNPVSENNKFCINCGTPLNNK